LSILFLKVFLFFLIGLITQPNLRCVLL
jgi:hypothetical protein